MSILLNPTKNTFTRLSALCALACVFALPAAAQWTPGGVNIGGYEQLSAAGAVSDGAGGVIVLWQDRRDGPYPNNFDVYAQRWSNTGAELWDAGGTPVCSLASSASAYAVVSDGGNGGIFVWVDGRTTGAGAGIYAQRVTGAGAHAWVNQGVLASTAGNFIGNVDAVADGSGGVVIAWVDHRSGGQNVYAQRLNASGVAQWPGDVTVPGGAAGAHYTPKILETLDGGAIVAWVSGTSLDRNVYAQRLDASGVLTWNLGLAKPVCVAPQSQSTLALASDGAGGVVIAWEDRRSGDDIYAQRLNASGALQWATNGVVVVDYGYGQYSPRACPDGTGGAIIMWVDERDQGSGGGVSARGGTGAAARVTEPDLYMQRLNGSGVAQWAADGIAISADANYQYLGQMVSDGVGGAVVSWVDDSDNDNNDDVMMQRYSASGNEVWASGGVVHATGVGSRQVFAQVTDGANTIPVWTTYLNSVAASGEAVASAAAAPGTFIYVQRVDNVDGDCTCSPSTNAGPVRATKPLVLTAAVPNPSAGAAELQVFLDRAGDVSVDVYDVRGRRVATQNVGHTAEGWRTLRFDGRSLPSGVYFYRVTAGGESRTRKIVVQR